MANSFRRVVAAAKREEREAKRRLRDLEKRLKEQAKLNELERARLEVEEFESRIEVLLSMHKQQSAPFRWREACAALPLHEPARLRAAEFAAMLKGGNGDPITRAREQDDQAYAEAIAAMADERAESARLKEIGRGVLSGEGEAYKRALTELGIFEEIGELGSELRFRIHNAVLVECTLEVIGSAAIPKEAKSLTSSGKLSVKAMPKGRFHEICQDYVCGCLLRVANEVFALLPVEVVLITARAEVFDCSTGLTENKPVLSVAFDRKRFGALRLAAVDPSDCVQEFEHRGEFKKSSKGETFTPIHPLSAEDFITAPPSVNDCGSLFARALALRDSLRKGR